MRPVCTLIAIAMVAAATSCSDSAAGVTTPVRSPRLIVVSGDGQVAEVAATIPQPLVVALLAGSGARMPGHFVVFRGGDARVDSALTDALGVASLSWRLPQTAGDYRIEASAVVGSIPAAGVTWRATAVPGPAWTVSSIGEDRAVVAPDTELDTLVVLVADRYGNPIANVPVSWSVVSGDGSLKPLQPTTSASGRANALWTVGSGLGTSRVVANAADSLAIQFTATTSPPFSASSVSASDDHSCSIDAVGTAWCWGANSFGQLGTGTVEHSVRNPVKVRGGIAFVSLALGHGFTCGLVVIGEAVCWGANDMAQLGSGVSGPSSVLPVRVAGRHAFTMLAAGRRHACGLTTAGEVYCWGESSVGQTGSGGPGVHRLPIIVTTTERFTALSAGNDFTCALSTAGRAYCWGSDERRQLGTDSPATCVVGTTWDETEGEVNLVGRCSSVPVRVAAPSNLVSLASGPMASCAVTADTRLLCWGNGRPLPTVVPDIPLNGSIVVGTGYVCGLDLTGGLQCDGFQSASATTGEMERLTFASLTGSASHLCGVSRALRPIVYCWGDNDTAQLGDGTRRSHLGPAAVVSPLSP